MYLTKNETQIGTEQIYLWYIKLQTDTDYKCFWLQEFFIFYFHLHENWEIFPVLLNISHFKMDVVFRYSNTDNYVAVWYNSQVYATVVTLGCVWACCNELILQWV